MVRIALRHLRAHPFFSLTAIVTLAIGIGANTAVFSLLHGVRWRWLPVDAPQDLVTVGVTRSTDDAPSPFPTSTPGVTQHLRTKSHLFADASSWQHEVTLVADRDGTLRTRVVGLVSGNGFEMLGVRAHHGRLLTPADDTPGGVDGDWPVVLGYRFWREQFAADPGVVGSSLTVYGTSVKVIGVAPRWFPGPWTGLDPAIYLPFRFAGVLLKREFSDARGHFFLADSLARVRPGVSRAALDAEKDTLKEWLFQSLNGGETKEQFFRRAGIEIDDAATGLPTEFRLYDQLLIGLQCLTGIVLCLCCSRVGALMRSRVDARRQLLIEAFLIALAGAALGSVIAWHGSRWLLPFFPYAWPGGGIATSDIAAMTMEPDRTVFLAAAITAVIVTLLVGVRPAWQRPGWPTSRIVATGLIAIQLAVALVLVLFATFSVRRFVLYGAQDFGFDVDRVSFQYPSYLLIAEKGDAKVDLCQRVVDRIAQAPGVTAAAITIGVPTDGYAPDEWSTPNAKNPVTGQTATLADATIGPGYFRAMGMTILEGREFARDERTRNVCILNRAAASFLFPNETAVGGDLTKSEQESLTRAIPVIMGPAHTCRVVGVVSDARDVSSRVPGTKTIYYPVAPASNAEADYRLVLLINATSKAAAIAAYRDARREVAPTLPLTPFATLREQIDSEMHVERAVTALAAWGAGVLLLLGAIGVYTVRSSPRARAIAISETDRHADGRPPEIDGRQR